MEYEEPIMVMVLAGVILLSSCDPVKTAYDEFVGGEHLQGTLEQIEGATP